MAPRLILEDVEYGFDGASEPLLRGVALDTAGIGRIGVLGASGIGKTTLFELIAGRIAPARGSITLNGQGSDSAAIGYCYQEKRLVPWLTLRENIEYGLPEGRARLLVDEMIERLELRRVAGTRASSASGGELARCAIGRALVSEPDMLLLDEPLGGLDRRVRDQVVADLLSLQKERNFLLLLISHEVGDFGSICEQVHVLAGRPASIVRSVSLVAETDSAKRTEAIRSAALAAEA